MKEATEENKAPGNASVMSWRHVRLLYRESGNIKAVLMALAWILMLVSAQNGEPQDCSPKMASHRTARQEWRATGLLAKNGEG